MMKLIHKGNNMLPLLLTWVILVHTGEGIAFNHSKMSVVEAPIEVTLFNGTLFATCELKPDPNLPTGQPEIYGQVLFKQTFPAGILQVLINVHGLPTDDQQKRAIHVHQFGDLSQGCITAGPHYNPLGVDHPTHPGDFGNYVAINGAIRQHLNMERGTYLEVRIHSSCTRWIWSWRPRRSRAATYRSTAPRTRPAQVSFTPAPGYHGAWMQQQWKTRARTSPPPPSPVFEISTQNCFAPLRKTECDAVIIGDSIVRHVRATMAKGKVRTCCFPGAHVLDVAAQVPAILIKNNIGAVVLHAGTNDTRLRQTEILKKDFRSLVEKRPRLYHTDGLQGWSSGPLGQHFQDTTHHLTGT
ncbi:extracellular superoxide dismutase isoform X2 [Pangasianodon hypophthalmus]|uniref:extracellular superoxide dismutase isoform X2 n=1 Tax=Pangasianodon hypophthalmus TaxID=310915 RepID=UPI00230782A5|nr:extracellular superoxide dismutase isoform X2 [Pangasianodon hypophthalmus]